MILCNRDRDIRTYQKYKNVRSEIFLKYSLRANHKPFINPEISKVIMTKTRLRNCFLKKINDANSQLFCKQIKAEKDYLISLDEEEVAVKLNDFFSNAIINLKILRLENFDLLLENIGDHPNLKDNVKYRKHPSIIAIASKIIKEYFSFNTIIIEDMLKEISMLHSSKAYRLLIYQ